ncbi:SRPBCC family protein [Spongisporangium articulatum]|uniref:SRPBCC family protein n=1 Tax=Spongisporangium articulatum TaxID=3362603 RepID=A0ABW8AS89_9ACTN
MRTFRMVTLWRLPAERTAVWEALADVRGWPRWWPGIEAVELLEPGDDAGLGRTARLTVDSGLGYRLTFTVRVTQVDEGRGLTARSIGHLVGTGHVVLADTTFPRGVGTAVTTVWEVALTRWWMRPLVPLGAPVLRRRHDVVMRRGERGLQEQLRRR